MKRVILVRRSGACLIVSLWLCLVVAGCQGDTPILGPSGGDPSFDDNGADMADENLAISVDRQDGIIEIASADDTLGETIIADGESPIADAGSDLTVDARESVVLDGSNSHDPDDDELLFTWSQTGSGPRVELENADVAVAGFVAPQVLESTLIQFMLTVNDGVFSAQDVAIVQVLPLVDTASVGPIADAGPDQEVSAGETVTLDGSASVASSITRLTFRWTQVAGTPVTFSGYDSSVATFLALDPLDESEMLVFELVVTEGDLSASDEANVTVVAGNAPDGSDNDDGPPPPPPSPECSNHVDCSDDVFCNGVETCASGSCQAGSDPCPPQRCDEARDACVECLNNGDCNDGIFCNGAEMCVGGSCQAGGNPCPTQQCDEASDTCVECLSNQHCDNGLYCDGDETCIGGACQSGAERCPGATCDEDGNACVDCLDNTDCDDGVFCNGAETCVSGSCRAGSDPCPTQQCDETGHACVECLSNSDCNDDIFCDGAEMCVGGSCRAGNDPCPSQQCNEAGDACVDCLDNSDCDDSVFCNGAESCVSGSCRTGSDPCPTQPCDEAGDACVECLIDSHCNNGLFCDGDGTCVAGVCQPGTNPCAGLNCDETNDACVDCLGDGDCDDGVYCNGAEACVGGVCQAGSDPCPGQHCDEGSASCAECLIDGHCDNGLFCDGDETCVAGVCQPGTNPCAGLNCDETNDACVDCLGDADCDDGVYCTKDVCDVGVCVHVPDGCPWPGGDESTRIDITYGDMGNNMSGAVWNPVTAKLWLVSNSGIFWRMSCDSDCDLSASWHVDTDGGDTAKWSCGGDTEAITQADWFEDTVFVGVERAGGIRRFIREYDVSGPLGSVSQQNSWELTEMASGGENDGLEALTFVPDGWLAAFAFEDANGDSYTSSVFGTGGLFFAGLQDDANVFVYDLDRSVAGGYILVGRYTTGQSEIAGLEFDRSNGILYSYHNYNGSGSPDVLQALMLTPAGSGPIRSFPVMASWYGPRVGNNEGIAILPNEDCDSVNDRAFFLTTDDAGTSNSVGIYPYFPCDCNGNGADDVNEVDTDGDGIIDACEP